MDRDRSPILRRAEAPSATTSRPSPPLWQRVPTRDDEGRPLSDFLMLVPDLKTADAQRKRALHRLERVLDLYRQWVVFAECDLRLGTLWVSMRARPGLCAEIPAAIHQALPTAKLVAERLQP